MSQETKQVQPFFIIPRDNGEVLIVLGKEQYLRKYGAIELLNLSRKFSTAALTVLSQEGK